MSPHDDLEQRLAAIRAEARAGATAATFHNYETLWRDARKRGAQALATSVLRDLAQLTSELDPAVAKELGRAADGAANRNRAETPAETRAENSADLDVSVIVLGLGGQATQAPVLDALDRQTLPAPRFETLLADGVDAVAVNGAVKAARGRLLVFVAPDVTLAEDALALHVKAHAGGGSGSRQLVLGALDREGLHLRPLAWALERLGLLGCQHAPEDGGAIPSESIAFEHASILRSEFQRAGGCDAALRAFAAVDLGTRLEKDGVQLRLEPSIRATRPPACDLDGWLTQVRAMGADWLALRRKQGAAARPGWLRELGLEEAQAELLLAQLLAGADGHARRVASLRESLQEIERVLARDPRHADAITAKVEEDLSQLVLQVTRQELMRGFVHAALGGRADELERCATRTRRGAAVLVLASGQAGAAVTTTLAHLPSWAELVVAWPAGTTAPALPDDPRIVRLALPRQNGNVNGNGGAGGVSLRRALLGATGADLFVLLDGSLVPTRADWEALKLTLATLPCIGACNVGESAPGLGGPGVLARAQLCASLPDALVATRRDVIESDLDETGPFLARLVRRGFRLATTTAATLAPEAPEPASCSV